MKLNIKPLVAAAVLALSGTAANAAIVTNNAATGNSSMMFQVISAGQSYALGLDIRMDDIIAEALSGTFTAKQFVLPGLPSFSDPANSLWGVVGADFSTTAGGTPEGQRRMLTSFTADSAVGPNGVRNNGIVTSAQNFDTIVNQVGPLCSPGAACVANSSGDGTYIGATPPWGSSWGFSSGFSNSVALNSGTSLALWLITPNGSQPTGTANTQQLTSNGGNALLWSLNGNILSLSAGEVAPVPIPGAIWMLGSALVGLLGIGRRRRSDADSAAVAA